MSEHYACLPVDEICLGERRLVTLRHAAMADIMHWRNAQQSVLRQREPLTPESQERYYRTVIAPSYAERLPGQVLFSYLIGEEAIGYGGLVHIAWEHKRAEVSFLVRPERASTPEVYEHDFGLFLRMIQEAAFRHLKLMRLFTETYDLRPRHVRVLEAEGFEFEGRSRAHVWIDGHPVDSLMHGCLNPELKSARLPPRNATS
jgi:RimJ/RimL family protein N-acetyltransferase